MPVHVEWKWSSYRVGGTRAFLKMLCYQSQLSNYFPSDGNHFMENYMFFILWKYMFYSHTLEGAEQAREVVTLVTSEAPSSAM